MLFFKQSIQLHLFVFFLVGVQFQLILGFNEKYTSQVMCVYSCHKTFITSYTNKYISVRILKKDVVNRKHVSYSSFGNVFSNSLVYLNLVSIQLCMAST
jgi:hypothetical protein